MHPIAPAITTIAHARFVVCPFAQLPTITIGELYLNLMVTGRVGQRLHAVDGWGTTDGRIPLLFDGMPLIAHTIITIAHVVFLFMSFRTAPNHHHR